MKHYGCAGRGRVWVTAVTVLSAAGVVALAQEADQAFLDLPYAAGFVEEAARADGIDPAAVRLAHVVRNAASMATSDGRLLLPAGTTFDALDFDDRGVAHVRLTFPADAAGLTIEPLQAATISHVVQNALGDGREINGIAVQARIADGPYRWLGEYGPRDEARPEQDVREALPPPQAEQSAEGSETEATAERLGGVGSNANGQPAGALSGVVVFCSAGHGWTAGTSSWFLQRPLLLDMVEDYGNLEQLNYFVNYLYNAGAVVVPFRPIGYQTAEIVLDNDDAGVTYTGSWSNSVATAEYYENGVTPSGVPYRFASANATETATARYTPSIPQADFYPVYCWTRDGTDRTTQIYRVQHPGGTAQVTIDHRRVGKGWIWLGTFYFQAGTAGYVEISNQSSAGGVVIADAIRFGDGIGDVVGDGPGSISGFPRDEEAQRYWAESEAGLNAVGMPSSIWDCCSTDQNDNVGTGSRWAREMNRTDINNDRWRRIYIEYHSNAAGCGTSTCGAKGTVCLVSVSAPTTNQQELATILGDEIEADMFAIDDTFEFLWGARSNPFAGEYGAISTVGNGNEFDATIVEVAFHDNVEDAANLRNATVRDAVARSTLQGVVKFLSNTTIFPTTQVPQAFLPDPPERVRAVHNGGGNVVVSWIAGPTGGAHGDAPTGYRIYRSTNGYGFGNVVDAGNVLSFALTDIPADVTTYLRVAAYNAGGESMPSEVIAVRRSVSGGSPVLVVNGFDRVSRQQDLIYNIPAGPMERPIARRVNAFDYVVQHADALTAIDVSFDSCANEAVTSGGVQLGDYTAVIWILGEESTADDTFSATEQNLVTTFLNGGGNLFVTGAEIAFDLDDQGGGVSFFETTLRGNYVGDDANTFNVQGTGGGILADVGAFNFSDASGAPYLVDFPDRIAPQSGAATVLTYVGGTGDSAGVQYDSGVYRVVMFGFPFETITSQATRHAIMQRVMDYLFVPQGPKADFDDDDDVDLADFGHLQACYTRPTVPQEDPPCLNARLDADTDVDQQDLVIFLGCLSGANVPANPSCAN